MVEQTDEDVWLARVDRLAANVFGDAAKAHRWLSRRARESSRRCCTGLITASLREDLADLQFRRSGGRGRHVAGSLRRSASLKPARPRLRLTVFGWTTFSIRSSLHTQQHVSGGPPWNIAA